MGVIYFTSKHDALVKLDLPANSIIRYFVFEASNPCTVGLRKVRKKTIPQQVMDRLAGRGNEEHYLAKWEIIEHVVWSPEWDNSSLLRSDGLGLIAHFHSGEGVLRTIVEVE